MAGKRKQQSPSAVSGPFKTKNKRKTQRFVVFDQAIVLSRSHLLNNFNYKTKQTDLETPIL